jgi:phosphatidate cytidylyltransferase
MANSLLSEAVSSAHQLTAWLEPLHAHVIAVLGGTLVALAAGTIVRLIALRGASDEDRRRRLGSLKSWWLIAILVCIALLLGQGGVVGLLACVSVLGFREFLKLTPAGTADRVTCGLAYAFIPLSGLWLWLGRWDVFVVWLPLTGLLLTATSLVLQGRATGFQNVAASLLWGLLLIAWCPAHAASFYLLPADSLAPAGAAGLVLYLLLLTEVNDIAQALVGRRLGRRRIAPVVSPNKTLEGLLGGIVCTTLLAVLLAEWLTPFACGPTPRIRENVPFLPCGWSIGAGLLICLGGFAGDITMSAVKRDAGVKDSGTLFPGQGGMLDRIDSLTFTAPLLAYYTRWIVL